MDRSAVGRRGVELLLLREEGVEPVAAMAGERKWAEDTFLGICSLALPSAIVGGCIAKYSLCRRFIPASLDRRRFRRVCNISN